MPPPLPHRRRSFCPSLVESESELEITYTWVAKLRAIQRVRRCRRTGLMPSYVFCAIIFL